MGKNQDAHKGAVYRERDEKEVGCWLNVDKMVDRSVGTETLGPYGVCIVPHLITLLCTNK